MHRFATDKITQTTKSETSKDFASLTGWSRHCSNTLQLINALVSDWQDDRNYWKWNFARLCKFDRMMLAVVQHDTVDSRVGLRLTRSHKLPKLKLWKTLQFWQDDDDSVLAHTVDWCIDLRLTRSYKLLKVKVRKTLQFWQDDNDRAPSRYSRSTHRFTTYKLIKTTKTETSKDIWRFVKSNGFNTLAIIGLHLPQWHPCSRLRGRVKGGVTPLLKLPKTFEVSSSRMAWTPLPIIGVAPCPTDSSQLATERWGCNRLPIVRTQNRVWIISDFGVSMVGGGVQPLRNLLHCKMDSHGDAMEMSNHRNSELKHCIVWLVNILYSHSLTFASPIDSSTHRLWLSSWCYN